MERETVAGFLLQSQQGWVGLDLEEQKKCGAAVSLLVALAGVAFG